YKTSTNESQGAAVSLSVVSHPCAAPAESPPILRPGDRRDRDEPRQVRPQLQHQRGHVTGDGRSHCYERGLPSTFATGGTEQPASRLTSLRSQRSSWDQDSSPDCATTPDGAGQFKSATTLAGAALARTIRSGKQATVKPVAGRAARL